MKFELKKPDAGMLWTIGGLAVSVIGAVIKGKNEERAKNEAIEKAAEKAYEKVMEQMSSKN